MKPTTKQTDAELNFNRTDAIEAVSANPLNPKVRQYLDEIEQIDAELRRREVIRSARRTLRRASDVLAYPVRGRWRERATLKRIAHEQAGAAWSLGWAKLYG